MTAPRGAAPRSPASSGRRVRRGIRRYLLIAVVLTGLLLAGWAFWCEPRSLVLRREALALPCWSGGRLSVAVVSDLHIGSPGTGLTKLDRVVAQLNESGADIILLPGDFVVQGVAGGRFVPPETIAAHLRPLRAPLGVYAVLGNHDWWLDAPRVERAFEAVGIRVLDDEAVKVGTSNSPFWLVGIADFWEGQPDVAAAVAMVTDAAPVLAMTHNPDVFPAIPRRVCLTVAGHTHGGQVAFPYFGRPIVPSRYGERFAVGWIEEDGRHLFVTSGLGTSIAPVRFRVPPEIAVLDIHRGG